MGLFDRISTPDGMLELSRFLEELNARVERLERSAADAVALYEAEFERQGRWLATRDAALTGLLANSHEDNQTMDLDRCLKAADYVADHAHGLLPPEE